jgi:protein-disulfide isomerase
MRGTKDIIQLLLAAMAFVLAIAVAAWLFFEFGPRPASTHSGLAADMPQAEFGRRVRVYLLDNPEIIAEAMQKLEARQQAAEQSEVMEVLKTRSDEIFRDPASPVGSNPEGDVSLVEFFDYNCPYCGQVAPHMVKAEANDPKLRIVYKEFPILGPPGPLPSSGSRRAPDRCKGPTEPEPQSERVAESGRRGRNALPIEGVGLDSVAWYCR